MRNKHNIHMQIIKTLVLCLVLFLFNTVLVTAASNIEEETNYNFDLKLKDVTSISTSSSSKFNFEIRDVKDLPSNVQWKIRAHCRSNMNIKIENSATNICYKKTKLFPKDNLFSFLFTNKSKKNKKFLVDLIAYDSKGRILNVNSENFTWN